MFERWTRCGKPTIINGMSAGSLADRVEALILGGQVSEAAALLRSAYDGSVRAFVAAHLRGVDAETVQDICQEVWLAALKGLAGFRGRADPGTWLLAIAQNKANDHLRARYRRPMEPIEAVISKLVVSSARGPSKQVAAEEQRALGLRYIEQLDPSARMLLVWRYQEGCLPSEWLGRIRSEGCGAVHGIEDELAQIDAAGDKQRSELEKVLKDRLMKRLGRAVNQIIDSLEASTGSKTPHSGT